MIDLDSNEVVVWTPTQETADYLFKTLRNNRIVHGASEKQWNKYKEYTCYKIHNIKKESVCVLYCSKEFYKENGYKIQILYRTAKFI